MEKIIVLGIGNILLTDEGFGVRVVEELIRRYCFPENVEIIDGGTMGYDLLRFLSGATKLIIIDAIKANSKPGTVYCFKDDEVKKYYRQKVSMHQLGIQEVLTMLEIIEKPIAETFVFGIEPASLDMSAELSPIAAALVTEVLDKVAFQLNDWGYCSKAPA